MTWTDLTKTEQKEVSRLCSRHRDIRLLGGPGALEQITVKEALQRRRQEWVEREGISCFKCKIQSAEWAAGGVGQYGSWVLCQPCARKPRKVEGAA